ncbi:MAG: hypothetical protein A2340_12980 [Lentisphaerae bacterium RIFOXYB12_FULL_60_10]|nr:MAG: hypothetical protein A2340_12980 [Lentisphaerae bacterium RIFOXYB12_FULL_60_10]
MLKRFKITENRLLPDDAIPAASGIPDSPVMVFVNPSDDERQLLIHHFQIDEHTLASALDPDELPRVEQEPDYMALIFKRPKSYSAADRFMFKISSVGVFLFKDRLIILLSEDLPILDGKLFSRVATLQDLVLKMIFRSIQHFTEHLKVINMISNDLEDQIIKAMENKHLLNMLIIEKSLVYYLSAIQGNGAVIDRLRMNATNQMAVGFNPDNVELIDDIAIENKQCYEQTRIYSDVLGGLMDARAAIINNNLNQLMKTLTLVMIAIMWPPLICGFLSMNIKLPVDQHNAMWPFFMVLIVGIVPVLVALVYWMRNRNGARKSRS